MRLLALLIAAAALLGPAAANADGPARAVERSTTAGRIAGSDDSAVNGTFAWKGIPFAQPPVGALRWAAPLPPARWKGVRPATDFGNACVQSGRIYGPGANNRYDASIGSTLGQAVGSEDCLYLNLWTPADRGGANTSPGSPRGGRPVIVFVHGGSNVSGYTADPVYDGAALARSANAVVVTVNYRLGIFGFFNLAQLKTGTDAAADSGNFALLDVVAALQWVQQNIERFGGDSGQVTLMGQSAGAINVWALLTAPPLVNAPVRLFHRAVPISGGLSLAGNLPPGRLPTIAPAATYALQGQQLLLQQVVASGQAADLAGAVAWVAGQTPVQVAAWLRAQPASALLATLQGRLAALGLGGSGPIPDGALLPVDPIAAIAAGRYLRMPVLAGNTRDEGKLFPTFLTLLGGPSGRLVSDAQLFAMQQAYQPDAPPQIAIEQWLPSFYLPVGTPGTGFDARTELLDTLFLEAARRNVLDTLRTQQAEVWSYRFDWDEQPAPFDAIYGAAHAFDLPFLFGNFGPSLFAGVTNSSANRPGRLALSAAMMQSLGAFARSGDPNNGPAPAALGVAWPAWPATLLFDATKTARAISVQ